MSHEINGKTMEPGSDPFKFVMEVDRLAADLHRLGDKSATELRKCVIIVSGLSADFEMECRILENNPAGLNRAEIERVVGNQYNRLLRQQQDSKASSASKGTVTANREKGKNRRLHHKFDGKCFNCGKKGHRAVDCRSAKKKSEKSGTTDDRNEGGGSGRCYICGSEEHLAHRHCGLCKSLEHRTRDCEERGAEKSAMLAKLTVPVVPEVREVTAMVERLVALGRKNVSQIPAPHSTCRTPTPECLPIRRRRRGRTLRSPTVIFYRWTGSGEPSWIWTNRGVQPRW